MARNWWLIAGLISLTGGALYPIIIAPMINPTRWQDIQKETRKSINQEDIQPVGLKVWSDPFDRKKE